LRLAGQNSENPANKTEVVGMQPKQARDECEARTVLDEPTFNFPASGWRFAALHVMIVRPSPENGSRAWRIKTNQEEVDEA